MTIEVLGTSSEKPGETQLKDKDVIKDPGFCVPLKPL